MTHCLFPHPTQSCCFFSNCLSGAALLFFVWAYRLPHTSVRRYRTSGGDGKNRTYFVLVVPLPDLFQIHPHDGLKSINPSHNFELPYPCGLSTSAISAGAACSSPCMLNDQASFAMYFSVLPLSGFSSEGYFCIEPVAFDFILVGSSYRLSPFAVLFF